MITVGLDVGAQTVKVAILADGKLLANSVVSCGIQRKDSIAQAFNEALQKAGISREEVKNIIATGTGKTDVDFANSDISEIIADARGVLWFCSTVKTVIDIGAEESRALKANADGKVLDFAKNEKCAAGVGAFVESMSRALELNIEEMAGLSLQSQKEIPMNVTCVVFAESEVVSLIHSNVAKPDIAKAIHDAIATRTTSMVRKVGIEKDVALIGGVAKNKGVVACLKKHLGVEDIRVPEEPQIIGAIGAALIAADQG
jgi:benzoyl-CoA reductase subunit D